MKYKHIALIRFVSSLLLALICFLFCQNFSLGTGNSFEISWIIFGASFLIQGIISMLHNDPSKIRTAAKEEDLSTWLQFLVIIACCSVSLFALIIWDRNDLIVQLPQQVLFVLSVSLSWFILHLSFTFRYAHLYYGDLNEKYQKHSGGLDFPNEEHPDYFDFAYYAYTIGMTFQVSDVTISTKGLRRLTLFHSLISFVFNTILVALTINEILK